MQGIGLWWQWSEVTGVKCQDRRSWGCFDRAIWQKLLQFNGCKSICFSNFNESPVFLGCSTGGCEKSSDPLPCVASMTWTLVLCFTACARVSCTLAWGSAKTLHLICAWRLSWDTEKEWRFTYHICLCLWSMWSPFFTAHGNASFTYHSRGYRSFAILPILPFQTAWHSSCTYPHGIPRCTVNIYELILNRKLPCCGSAEVSADYSILWKRH